MSHLEITGRIPLFGEVTASGAKNAALPIMAAALLASAPVRLERVPRVTDVATQAALLRHLGLKVAWLDRHTLWLETVDDRSVDAPQKLVRRMRAGFCVLGPLLARRHRAVVPLPGGCNLGNRPVDLHLKGLAALGATMRIEHGCIIASAERLRGASIDLRGPAGPTVTGTANVISAAVLARGTTILKGAATEPEVVDLGRFLVALGARIEGLGTATVRIEGAPELGGATHRLIPDRIEAATLLMAGAITAGSVTVKEVVPRHLASVAEKLAAAGAEVTNGRTSVSLAVRQPLRAVDIVAQVYPGMPTDLQALWTALASVSSGKARIRDSVFPARVLHVAELNRLGAQIDLHDGCLCVGGNRSLSGARVAGPDLRASAALVLAGLAAEGQTIVERLYHLDRGYERLDAKLRRLGAQVQRRANLIPSP